MYKCFLTLTQLCMGPCQDFREELRRLREELRSLTTGLDEISVEVPAPSVVEEKSVRLSTLENELARLQRLLAKWARAKYRGAQGTTILSNELRVQCEEMAAFARTKLSDMGASAPDSSG